MLINSSSLSCRVCCFVFQSVSLFSVITALVSLIFSQNVFYYSSLTWGVILPSTFCTSVLVQLIRNKYTQKKTSQLKSFKPYSLSATRSLPKDKVRKNSPMNGQASHSLRLEGSKREALTRRHHDFVEVFDPEKVQLPIMPRPRINAFNSVTYKAFSKGEVMIPNYSCESRRSEWVGYTHDAHKIGKLNIIKYHFSIDADSMEIALPLLLDLLVKHQISVFKIIKREHLNDPDITGKEVVVYYYQDDSPEKAEIFLRETCSFLHRSGIKKGAELSSDLSIDGAYCYARCDNNVWGNYFSTQFLRSHGFIKEEAACLNPEYVKWMTFKIDVQSLASPAFTKDTKYLSPKFSSDLHKHESIMTLSERIYDFMILKLNESFLKLIIGDTQGPMNVDKNVILYFFLCKEEYASSTWSHVHPSDIERIQLEKMMPSLRKAAHLAAYLHLSLERDPSMTVFGNILPAVYHKMLIPWKMRSYSASMPLFDSIEKENDFVKAAALCILREPDVPYPKPVLLKDSSLDVLIEILKHQARFFHRSR